MRDPGSHHRLPERELRARDVPVAAVVEAHAVTGQAGAMPSAWEGRVSAPAGAAPGSPESGWGAGSIFSGRAATLPEPPPSSPESLRAILIRRTRARENRHGALAFSFHLGTFTPLTRSHRQSPNSAKKAGSMIQGNSSRAANSGDSICARLKTI
jgi:hypothetical protein